MIPVNQILFVAGFILLMLAGFGIGAPRANLGWYGLACLTLACLLGGII